MSLQLIHIVVQQKLTQHCKAIVMLVVLSLSCQTLQPPATIYEVQVQLLLYSKVNQLYVCMYIYVYIYLPSLLDFPPVSPFCPSPQVITEHQLSSLCCTAASHQRSIFHVVVYIRQCYFLDSSHCSLPYPHCVHKSTFYVCISIPVLQIGLSVPFFQIPYVYVNI